MDFEMIYHMDNDDSGGSGGFGRGTSPAKFATMKNGGSFLMKMGMNILL